MTYGFTGTRAGMTERQQHALDLILCDHDTNTAAFHHGGCHGADAEAHKIAAVHAARHVHPGDKDQWRGWKHNECGGRESGYAKLHPWKPYLERNHTIVDICDVLIAAPKTPTEELRSGTWATIRYARKIGRPVIILDP